MEYKVTDVSIIIPTYNRQKELLEMLPTLKGFDAKEIIIVDQSKGSIGDKVRKLGKKFKYVMNTTPSITMARNLGVRVSKGKVICFLDDDVRIKDNYFNEILSLFNNNPRLEGAAGYRKPQLREFDYLIDSALELLFIRRYDCETANIKGVFSNTYPIYLDGPTYCQWFPGLNMVFKREVFQVQEFDENLLGYTLAEDIDFTYRIYKRNHEGLMITPHTEVEHNHSSTARPDLEKMGFINMIDHFYFYYKNLEGEPFESFKLWWSLGVIAIFRTLAMLTGKERFIKGKVFYKALAYCLTHKNEIKRGEVRKWID